MKKIILLFALLLIVAFASYSQPLKIGDKFPDLELTNVFNYKTNKIKLSQFKAGLFILDYMGINCEPCIEAFPKIDSLQKQFAGKVQFIVVNRESYDVTAGFFAKRSRIKLPQVPFVTGNKILFHLFRVGAVPSHVWLDSNLIVRYVTDGSNSNAQNIQDFLDKKPLDFYQLDQVPEKQKLNIPEGLNYYSYIAPAVPGTTRHFADREVLKGKIYFTSEGTPIIDLLEEALGNIEKHEFKWNDSVVLEVKDINRFKNTQHIDWNKWAQQNTFNYYLMLPEERKDKLYQYIKQDIERYFNITATLQTRKVFYYVLVRKGKSDKLKSKGGIPADKLKIWIIKDPVEDSLRFMRNIPFEVFSDRIGTYMQGLFRHPFKDETGYKGNIDINLNAAALDAVNVLQIRKELWKYGLDIILTLRNREVLVIQDN